MQSKDASRPQEQAIHAAANAHSIIAITDANGIINFVNENFLRLSGYEKNELIGKTHAVVNSGHHPPEFFYELWQCIKSGKSWRGNIKNRTKTGDFYWVDTTITPIKGHDGAITGFSSVRTDITEIIAERDHRKVEAENAACLKALYEITCDASSLKIVLDNALQRLMAVSWLKFENKSGIFLADEASQVIKLAAAHNLGAIEGICAKVAFGQCLCGRAAQSREIQFSACVDDRHDIRIDGMQPHGHYNVPLIHDQVLMGVLVVYLPHNTKRNSEQEVFLQVFANTLALIIRLKNKQIRLSDEVERSNMLARKAQKASQEALQAVEAKGNFLATMSHEIRTPMNSVLGMLYLMEQSDLTEEQKEYAAIGHSSANSLMQIIDDILDFSKYERGAFTLEETSFDLPHILQESLEAFKQTAKAKGLQLDLQIRENVPSLIKGDPSRLRQIITNLVSNAIKFTTKGRVLVKVDAIGEEVNPQFQIMVVDSGTGIDPGALDQIFERFSQADTSITRKFGGTGLGLAICKTLAETMGGTIGVETVLDEGSSFWVRLPLVPVEDAIIEVEAEEEGDNAAHLSLPLNILVAEDNPHNQFLIRKMLEVNHHQVTCVDDGLKAVELAASEAFDVILMDLQMPVLDGLSATEEIRKLPAPHGQVPIYAVTANALGKHHEQTSAAGMNGHINKPIQPAELYGVLDDIKQQKLVGFDSLQVRA